jgi:hypothetical protein
MPELPCIPSATGIKISDEDMAALNISRNPFHAEWNYTIHPQ